MPLISRDITGSLSLMRALVTAMKAGSSMAGMPSLPGPPERISAKLTVQRVKSVSDHPLLNRLAI